MRLEETLRIGNQFRNLVFILCLNSLCLFHLRAAGSNPVRSFFFCKGTVPLCRIDTVLQGHYPVGTIRPEAVNLFLNLTNIILNRLAQLHLLLSRKSLIVSFCHIHESPL